jgi:hypothetical protein
MRLYFGKKNMGNKSKRNRPASTTKLFLGGEREQTPDTEALRASSQFQLEQALAECSFEHLRDVLYTDE